jgi:hypothetical protein
MKAPTALTPFATFVKSLPPETAADCVKVVKDLAIGLVADLNAAIDLGAPDVPLIRGFIVTEGKTITDDTVNNLVGQLDQVLTSHA